MAKQATIKTITSGYASNTQLNFNFDALNDQFDNTLSLDGSTPNAMGADLDMNSNNITNAADVSTDTLTVAGVKVTDATYVPNWEGPWLTTTAYVINDLVSEAGSTYICLVAHTSGTFSTDLAAAKWELFAQQGSAGAGTGDMLAANNLSDVANASTSLTNLGGGTTGIAIFKDSTAAAVRTEIDAQQQDDILDDLVGLTQATDKVPYFDSATTASVLDFLDEDTLVSDSATAVASQQSIKAYVDSQTANKGFSSVQVFTASGTWTRPTDITKVHIIVTGGGEGGDSNDGGGAGGTALGFIDVSAISSSTITIGSGGASGAANGGNSSWADGTNTLTGVGGGAVSQGVGGIPTGGDLNVQGGRALVASSGAIGGPSYWGGVDAYGSGGRQSAAGTDGVIYVMEYK